MNKSDQLVWRIDYSIETDVAPAIIWRHFADVSGWPAWNAGIETISIEGPFAEGTVFRMKPPGEEPLLSRLVRVVPEREFVDETMVGELAVRVSHRIEAAGSGRTRIVYGIEAAGPGADAVVPMVSADFPSVLKSLVGLVESETQGGGDV